MDAFYSQEAPRDMEQSDSDDVALRTPQRPNKYHFLACQLWTRTVFVNLKPLHHLQVALKHALFLLLDLDTSPICPTWVLDEEWPEVSQRDGGSRHTAAP